MAGGFQFYKLFHASGFINEEKAGIITSQQAHTRSQLPPGEGFVDSWSRTEVAWQKMERKFKKNIQKLLDAMVMSTVRGTEQSIKSHGEPRLVGILRYLLL